MSEAGYSPQQLGVYHANGSNVNAQRQRYQSAAQLLDAYQASHAALVVVGDNHGQPLKRLLECLVFGAAQRKETEALQAMALYWHVLERVFQADPQLNTPQGKQTTTTLLNTFQTPVLAAVSQLLMPLRTSVLHLGDLLADKRGIDTLTLPMEALMATQGGSPRFKVLSNHDLFALLKLFSLKFPQQPLSQDLDSKLKLDMSHISLTRALALGDSPQAAAETLWPQMLAYFKGMQLIHYQPNVANKTVVGMHNLPSTENLNKLLNCLVPNQSIESLGRLSNICHTLNEGWQGWLNTLLQGHSVDRQSVSALIDVVFDDPYFRNTRQPRALKSSEPDAGVLRWLWPFEGALDVVAHGHCLDPYAKRSEQGVQVIGLNNNPACSTVEPMAWIA